MAVFSYKAVDLTADSVSGTLVADTPRRARDLLRSRGLTVHAISERRSARRVNWPAFRRRSAHPEKVAAFIRQFSTLLGVGMPILEALDTLLRQHTGSFAATLLQLRDRVAGGSSLAEAMRQQTNVFDTLSIDLVEVGESAGTLDVVLQRLTEFKERSAAFRNRLATAMIYPCVVLLMAIGTSITLMTFVVPNLLSALTDAGRPLPWPTKVVKTLSDGLINDWWILLAVLLPAIVATAALLHRPRGRLAWHRLQLRLPLIGELTRKQATVRMAVVLSTLLKSGMVFVRALHIAADATSNLVLADALRSCERAVTSGSDIGDALGATDAFPPVVVQVFAVGQHSGRLEEMLEKLALDYDAEVLQATRRLTAVLEPVLILMLVVIVGFIGFATVMPLMEAADAF